MKYFVGREFEKKPFRVYALNPSHKRGQERKGEIPQGWEIVWTGDDYKEGLEAANKANLEDTIANRARLKKEAELKVAKPFLPGTVEYAERADRENLERWKAWAEQ